MVVESTKSRSMPRNILVGRVVTPLWGDGSVPMKVINPTDKPITIKRNARLADVYPCLAVEELQPPDSSCPTLSSQFVVKREEQLNMSDALKHHGLSDLNLDSCEVSEHCKKNVFEVVLKYSDIFSKHKLDCGEVKDFVHKIHLVDGRLLSSTFQTPIQTYTTSTFPKAQTCSK